MAAISQTELERRLGLGRVDQRELDRMLTSVFGGSHYPSDRRIDYPPDGPRIISLIYDKRGVLKEIVPGEALTAELLDRIESEVTSKLLVPPKPMVCRMPLLAWYPTEGYWRYKDKLVILPVPAEAARPHFIAAPHPLVLEVAFQGATDPYVASMRARREFGQLALFLSLLIPGLQVPSIPNGWHHRWVFVHGEPLTPITGPVLAEEHYAIPDFEMLADALTDQDDLPGIELVERLPWAMDVDQQLELPVTISKHLDIFLRLPGDGRRKVLRAAYWLHHAQEVWYLSKSASYVALVQAVEALIQISSGQPKSSDGDEPVRMGATKLFKEFIARHAPMHPGEESARRALYKVRSDLTHGKMLFYADEEMDIGWHSPMPVYERQLGDQARAICRRAIIGWLDSQVADR